MAAINAAGYIADIVLADDDLLLVTDWNDLTGGNLGGQTKNVSLSNVRKLMRHEITATVADEVLAYIPVNSAYLPTTTPANESYDFWAWDYSRYGWTVVFTSTFGGASSTGSIYGFMDLGNSAFRSRLSSDGDINLSSRFPNELVTDGTDLEVTFAGRELANAATLDVAEFGVTNRTGATIDVSARFY